MNIIEVRKKWVELRLLSHILCLEELIDRVIFTLFLLNTSSKRTTPPGKLLYNHFLFQKV